MPRAALTPEMDARLLAEREADRGYGHVRRIAARLGLSYSQAYSAFLRLDGKRKTAAPVRPSAASGRVCRCGKPVLNDESTDYRFCETCRGTAVRSIARFVAEARR